MPRSNPVGGCSTDEVAAAPRRLLDLVLFNHVDQDLVPLRIAELRGHVDLMGFAETEYTHSTGERKPLRFKSEWLTGAPFVHYRPIRALANVTSECNIRALAAHPQNTWLRRKKQGPQWVNRCRESFSRNALGQLFEELGGGDDDWALISDADEIPRPAALAVLRKLMHQIKPTKCWLRMPPAGMAPNRSEAFIRRQIMHRLPAVSLGAIHHFKYTVGCERPWRLPGATWLKGPIAVPGALLKTVGAQSARTFDGCFWSGWRNSCRDISRRAISNASWHMSSLSGGFEGHLQKMRENSAHALYTNDSRTNQFEPRFVLERALQCQHGEDQTLKVKAAKASRKGLALHYLPTPWGQGRPLPRYPDVPMSVQRALSEGRLRHFLGWNTTTAAAEGAGVEPLGQALYLSDPKLLDESVVPHPVYRLTR